MKALVIGAMAGLFCLTGQAQTVSPLFARGYTVIPQPQKVSLGAHDFAFTSGWRVKLDKSVPVNAAARHLLTRDYHLDWNNINAVPESPSSQFETVSITEHTDPQ